MVRAGRCTRSSCRWLLVAFALFLAPRSIPAEQAGSPIPLLERRVADNEGDIFAWNRLAGLYLAASAPANTVIVTSQESGGARYYTKLPILRWDQLDVDLDTAVAALRAMRRHPVLLVEDWEGPQITKRHPRSVNARLDWAPRGEFGDETRVFLYDPADRGGRQPWRVDRVH